MSDEGVRLILNKLDGIEKRMDAIEQRMDAMEIRMDAMEKRMDAMENRMDSMENEIKRFGEQIQIQTEKTEEMKNMDQLILGEVERVHEILLKRTSRMNVKVR